MKIYEPSDRRQDRHDTHFVLMTVHGCNAFLCTNIPKLQKTVGCRTSKLRILVQETYLENGVRMSFEGLKRRVNASRM